MQTGWCRSRRNCLLLCLKTKKNRAWKKLLLLQLILASPVPTPSMIPGRVFRPVCSRCAAERLQMSISTARAKLPTEKFPSWLGRGLLGGLALVLAGSQRPGVHQGWARWPGCCATAVPGPAACSAESFHLVKTCPCWDGGRAAVNSSGSTRQLQPLLGVSLGTSLRLPSSFWFEACREGSSG